MTPDKCSACERVKAELAEAIEQRDQYEEELSQMRDWKDDLLRQVESMRAKKLPTP